MKKIFIALVCLSLSVVLFAQKPPVKFGKIDDVIVKMTSHPIYSSADAIVIMDFGETKFRYDRDNGFVYEFKRITRIKILTKDGLGYGDFSIPYYHDARSKESILNIKGYTYNYKDGSIIKSKLEKSSIFDEKSTKNWDKKKISMPAVGAGSVIELTYTISSPFIWNLITWKFQDDIPTIYSEYRATVPEYFDYQLLQSGYHQNITFEKERLAASVMIQSSHEGKTYGSKVRTSTEPQRLNFNNNKYRWVAKNVPAFKTEAYVSSPYDYLSKIKFELRGTKYPNSVYKAYMGTWEALNKSFMEATGYGKFNQSIGFMKDELEKISALNTDKEKINTLVKLVRNQIEWNNRYNLYASPTLRKAWINRKGSSADINLTIVAGLRKLGFDTDPVLISTRGHGMIRERYAISNQFNSVIAMVKLDGDIILLDGTDRYLPVSVLPKKCLNRKGWRVSKTSPGWVQIKPTINQERRFQATFNIETSGSIVGEIIITDKGYSGYAAHKKLKFKGEEKYFEDVQNKNPTWFIEEYEYSTSGSYNEPFKSKYTLELNEDLTLAGDIIYFNPTLDEIMNENPFKLEKREYPVDFAFPIRNVFMFKFNLPVGYSVEEMPKSIAFALPNNTAIFRYNISTTGNSIQVMVDFRINKAMFSQTEYPALKLFYDQIVQKCAEQVVLKKYNP